VYSVRRGKETAKPPNNLGDKTDNAKIKPASHWTTWGRMRSPGRLEFFGCVVVVEPAIEQ